MSTIDASARKEILDYLETVSNEIADLSISKKMYASGKTIKSLEVIGSDTGGGLFADPNIIFLETGRGPTSPTGPYMQDPDGKTLLQHVEEWIDAKGLDLNPYAVTKTIHQKGTKLFRQGGKSGILSVPLRLAGIDNLFNSIATLYAQNTVSEIYEEILVLEDFNNTRRSQLA